MAPTRESMQSLIDACAQYCMEFCLTFNVKKTKVMIFGKIFTAKESLAGIYLNGERVDYVSKTKYLGFIVVSGRTFGFSVHEDLCGFFASANSILTCTVKPKENVQLQLLYSNCVPKLSYGAEVKELTASEKHKFNVAINNSVRRIFGFRRWESIRHLREYYKFDSIEVIFAKAKHRFQISLHNHSNRILRFISCFTQ